MLKYHFPNVCEDELINIYSYGDFKGQGKYICLFIFLYPNRMKYGRNHFKLT